MGWNDDVPFETLKGMTLTEVTGAEPGSDRIVFATAEGRSFLMHHRQDCCESVSVEDVAGNVADLIGSALTMAEEVSDDDPEFVDPHADDSYRDSFTWTFYKLATVKGYVTLRWYGESNGYYSESVDFEEIK